MAGLYTAWSLVPVLEEGTAWNWQKLKFYQNVNAKGQFLLEQWVCEEQDDPWLNLFIDFFRRSSADMKT